MIIQTKASGGLKLENDHCNWGECFSAWWTKTLHGNLKSVQPICQETHNLSSNFRDRCRYTMHARPICRAQLRRITKRQSLPRCLFKELWCVVGTGREVKVSLTGYCVSNRTKTTGQQTGEQLEEKTDILIPDCYLFS